jgi:hypothetical protein
MRGKADLFFPLGFSFLRNKKWLPLLQTQKPLLCAFLVWHGNCSKAREIMEELGKKMKIEMDNNNNYGHLERPNLSKALQEA